MDVYLCGNEKRRVVEGGQRLSGEKGRQRDQLFARVKDG